MTNDSQNPLSDFYFLDRKGPSRPAIDDLSGSVVAQLEGLGLPAGSLRGKRLAVAVGSRGIANLQAIVRAVCGWLKAQGAQPFIFPAMGSHGGATAEGQRQVLTHYGITPEGTGAEVISSMETLVVGTSPQGFPIFVDRRAWESDGIVILSRVKPHSDLFGKIESGMLKMMTIGLGKCQGATEGHKQFLTYGFEPTVRAVSSIILASGKILFGVAVVENELHAIADVRAALSQDIVAVEESAIALARALMPRLPFRRFQLLMVDEIGQNISGAGMDTKVIGRVENKAHADGPEICLIYARDLTDESEGNAIGVGSADLIHERLYRKVDLTKTYLNAATSLHPAGGRLPMHMPSDRAALELARDCLGSPDPASMPWVWIHNTLSLNRLAISPALREEVESPSNWRLVEKPFTAEFDAAGNLSSPF